MIDRDKFEAAEFYALRNKGEIKELRKSKASISTPFGLEHLSYWDLFDYQHRKKKIPLSVIEKLKRSIVRTKQAANGMI